MAAELIICDTDVMIDYWDVTNSRHHITKQIIENEIGLSNIVLPAITKMELMLGAKQKRELTSISKQLRRFNIALINNQITEQAFTLLEKYHLSHGLALPDSIIAATALVTGIQCFTYNVKHFKFIEGIKLYTSTLLV